MLLKCIAIDDEPLALQQLCSYIKKTPFLLLLNQFQSAVDAKIFLENNEVDVMFVDINMPDINGVDFVKSMPDRPQVIFTTAYSQYAIDGFQVNAIDYILKPISYDVFLKSANKAKLFFERNTKPAEIVETTRDYLFVKSEYKLIRILLADIKYIESANEYIQIHLLNQPVVTTLVRLKSMEEQLPKNKFMRIHRSFIVNLDQVKVIERNRIIFDQKVYIPVGEQYKDAFQAFIDKTFLI